MSRPAYALALAALLSGPAAADDKPPAGDPYPLETCPVSGKKLGSMGDPHVYSHQGREIRFCCVGCVGTFEKSAEGYLERIDSAITERQKPAYVAENCPVSGKKLGGDGMEPSETVVLNRYVRLCCPDCLPKAAKAPGKALAKIDEAVVAKQKASYPMDTCVVSGEKLGEKGMKPVDRVFGTRMVRFCCKDCEGEFRKDPEKYYGKLGHAAAAKAAKDQ